MRGTNQLVSSVGRLPQGHIETPRAGGDGAGDPATSRRPLLPPGLVSRYRQPAEAHLQCPAVHHHVVHTLNGSKGVF